MNKRVAFLLAIATGAGALPSPANAWGDEGHKTVGRIAAHFLDPSVRAQVNALLAGDTTQLVSPTDIADEATWADKYRDSDRNTTKKRYDQTHLWHYVDIELAAPDMDAACNYHPPVPPGTLASAAEPNDCVVDKIDQFVAELSDPSTPGPERQLALQFLLHFVGDLHQPLHSSDDHDQGGNLKKVHGAGTSANLHSSWDTPFVSELGTSDEAIANDLLASITPALQAQWSQGTSVDWAQEAFQLAKTEAYGKLPAPAADGSYTLDSAYVDNAKQVVRQQLSKAGVRLAWVLNRALAGSAPPPPPPQEMFGNPGFENGRASPSPWRVTSGVVSDDGAEPAHSGQWAAWLDGYGQATTDRLAQTVVLPATISSATLSFWLHVDTEETSKTKAYDKLRVQLLDSAGRVLTTLATYSNLDAGPGYRQVSFDVSAFRGQKLTVSFTGKEDNAKRTSFVLDDLSLTVR